MAATPFKVVSWSPDELVSKPKLDAMVSNDNWLRDNMTRGMYAAHGTRRTEGIKISTGVALITARKSASATRTVGFDGFFTSVCSPVVTTGLVTEQEATFHTIKGIGKTHPDSRGFQASVRVWNDKKTERRIKRNMYVSWHAVGF